MVTGRRGAHLGSFARTCPFPCLQEGLPAIATSASADATVRPRRPEAALALARRAAVHFGLLFTGVDLMETPEGGFIVLEVSAFGGFRGLLEACAVDAAPLFAEAALRRFTSAA